MTPGPVEETAKVADHIVDSLKHQPISLALILLNVIFLVVGYLILARVSDRSAEDAKRADDLISQLTKCYQIPPAK